MKLGYTSLYVENVGASFEFYIHAFGLAPRHIHDSGDFAELEAGNNRLSFTSRRLMRELGTDVQTPHPAKPSFELFFIVDDVELALCQALDAGAKLVQPPQQMPWGQTAAYVHDLEGFLVKLCTEPKG